MDNPYDYQKLMGTLIDEIKAKTGIDTYESNSMGPEHQYPFYTFDIIDPHVELPFTDNVDNEEFEIQLEMMAHSDSHYEALNLASQLHKLFKTYDMDILGENNGFYVVEADDIATADNTISIQVERRASFELVLRVLDSFRDDIPTIDDAEINGADLSDKNNYGKQD